MTMPTETILAALRCALADVEARQLPPIEDGIAQLCRVALDHVELIEQLKRELELRRTEAAALRAELLLKERALRQVVSDRDAERALLFQRMRADVRECPVQCRMGE